MSFLSCKFYNSYFYFIIYWVLDILNNIEWGNFQNKYNYKYYYDKIYDKRFNINTKYFFPFAVETELFNLVTLILADLFFGFVVAYTCMRMNCIRKIKNEFQQKKRTAKNKYNIELIYNKPSFAKNAFILIVIISILDFVARSMELFFFLIICQERAEEKHIRWLITIEILPRIFFCFFILKIKLYRHHLLSLLFFFIGFLFISIFGIMSIETKNQKKYVFTMVVPKVLYALEDTLNKIILTDTLVLPHFLLFFRGFINTIFVSILILALYFTSNIDFRYYNNILNNIQANEIIFKLLSIIFMIFKIFCIFQIIYIFTPQHVGFCIVIIYIFNAIKNMILTKDFQNEFYYFLINIICLIFIGFGTIIFNEMVIFNCCGLNENTKSGKINKEKLERIELSDTTFNEDNEDNSKSLEHFS